MADTNKVAPKVGDKVALFGDVISGETGTIVKIMTINAKDFCRVDWGDDTSDEWADGLTVVEPR